MTTANTISGTKPSTERRWFRASVREIGAIGSFDYKNFHIKTIVSQSEDAIVSDAIMAINETGYEVQHIIPHMRKQ